MINPAIIQLFGESVTKRTMNFHQPKGGFIPIKDMTIIDFNDKKSINPIPSEYANISGLVVDYMTRYLVMREYDETEAKKNAFKIPLCGAIKTNNFENQKRYWKYFKNINGLSIKSVKNAAKIVCFDSMIRINSFNNSDLKTDIDDTLAKDLIILIKRCVRFFKEYGPVYLAGFCMDGGYSDIIVTGDGDYLTENTLWDFKVSKSKPNKTNTLQILVYYIMGIHSIHVEFDNINKIGIFNPFLNKAYYIDIDKISDKTMHTVSRDVIGYNISDDITKWRELIPIEKKDNDDDDTKDTFDYLNKIFGFEPTDFSIEKYSDGIHKISHDDYRTFCHQNLALSRIKDIFFLKKGNYYMFAYISTAWNTGVFNGGNMRNVNHDITFLYKYMDVYGDKVIRLFSEYWDYLKRISQFIRKLEPDQKYIGKIKNEIDPSIIDRYKDNDTELQKYIDFLIRQQRPQGFIHGAIIDIDFYNHIFVNPLTGEISSYNAETKFSREKYNDLRLLIKKEKPQLLESYDKINKTLLIEDNSLISQINNGNITTNKGIEEEIDGEISKDMDMYDISAKMLSLQSIYDHHYITHWYDSVIKKELYDDRNSEQTLSYPAISSSVTTESKDKHEESKNFSDFPPISRGKSSSANRYIGKSKIMKNGKRATITKFNSKWDITIQFDDGREVKNKTIWDFKSGKIE